MLNCLILWGLTSQTSIIIFIRYLNVAARYSSESSSFRIYTLQFFINRSLITFSCLKRKLIIIDQIVHPFALIKTHLSFLEEGLINRNQFSHVLCNHRRSNSNDTSIEVFTWSIDLFRGTSTANSHLKSAFLL